MLGDGGSQKEALRPNFDRSIMIDFRGAKISSDTGFLLLREIDERFDIMGPMSDCLEDRRSPVHTKHSLVQVIRQRVYQIAAGYEDCNDADYLRIDPALHLAIGKGHKMGASQSMMSRLENDILGNETGLKALDGALQRSTDALLKRQDKLRLIVDVDSTKDPAHGSQERVAYNGHFGVSCFHPLFAFTGEGTCLGAKLRPGNVHSADGTLPFIHPIVERYPPWFDLFWIRSDAAFASPDIYEYCEKKRITYFIRLRANACPTVSRTKVDGESIRNKSLLSSQSHIPQWRSSKMGFIEYIRKWIRNYPIFFVSVKGLEGTIFGLIIGYFIWGCEK